MIFTVSRNILFLLFFVCCTLPIEAQDKPLQYSYRHFGTENGLTQNSVQDAVFDKSGYLWISIRTDNVFVYDGYRFAPCWFYKNGRKSSFKSAALFCNSAGDIFVSHENGMHLKKQHADSFIQVSNTVISSENGATVFIGEGQKQEIYFYNRGIIYVMKPAPKNQYQVEILFTIGGPECYFNKSIDGTVKKSYFWFKKNNENNFHLFDIDQQKVIKDIPTDKEQLSITVFAIDSSLYTIGSDYTIYKSIGTQWKAQGQLNKLFRTRDITWQLNSFSNHNNKDIFVSFDKYVYQFNQDATRFTSQVTNTLGKPVISKGGINKILQQDADHLWFFTTAEGFYQLDIKPKKFDYFHTDEGDLNFVRSIYKDESTGYVFSGLFYGGIVVYNAAGKKVKYIPMARNGIDDRGGFCVNGITKLSNNLYLVWYNAGRAYLLNNIDWSLKSIINAGHLWKENYLGTVIDYAGFLRMGANKFASGYRNRIYFFTASVKGIAIQDSIVCPLLRPEALYYTAPLLYYGGIGSWYRYHMETKKIDSFALPFTTRVKWISPDKYKRLWIATESGIAIVENDKVIKTLTTDNGLPNHYIYVVEPDDKGKMWCSSNKGIFSIDINNFSVTGYSTVDGLQSEEFNTGAFFRDSANNFYYGGLNGLNFFQPASMKENEEAAVVNIDFIGSGDSVLYQYPNNLLPEVINLSYQSPSLLTRFTTLNYKTQGFNQYEYKLHVSDANWEDNGSNNELQLLLSPGEYTIQVRLKNLPHSETKIKVLVHPPFYQTIWFGLLVMGIIASAVALIVNRHNKNKYRKKIALLEMQQKMQSEKERIARDLHDDIGTKVNMLAYNVSLIGEIKSPVELQQVSERIKDTSDDMLQSLRETVWTLKQEHITIEDVWTRCKNFIAKLQQTYSLMQFNIEEDIPSDKKIKYNEALNLIRILQEAVSNAIKHSKGSIIHCAMKNEATLVSFTVHDNGKGFDSLEKNSLHDGNGLENMQQRATESGFIFSIETLVNNGTTVMIKI